MLDILQGLDVNLGLMFNPEAYITATRQSVAQANKWSLEELKLQVTITNDENAPLPTDECSFSIRGRSNHIQIYQQQQLKGRIDQ